MYIVTALIAWALPILAIVFHQKITAHVTISYLSFIACAVSLVMIIFKIGNWIAVSDWSALMDTITAWKVVGIVVVTVTVILNLLHQLRI